MSNLSKVQQNLQNLAKTAEAASSSEINRALKGKLQQVEETRKPLDLQPEWETAQVARPVATGDWEEERVGVQTCVSEPSVCRVDPFASLAAVGAVSYSDCSRRGCMKGKAGESVERLKAKHTAAF